MKTSASLYASAAVGCLLVSGCNWVDSAGSDGVPITEVFLDDQPVDEAIVLNEKSIGEIATGRVGSLSGEQEFVWNPTPLAQGNLALCAEVSGFNVDLAADSLLDACTDVDDCSLEFQQVDTDEALAEFNLPVPELKASVGMRYQLTTRDSAGRESSNEYDFCLIAINEAPVAVNDTFVVLEGTRESFGADDVNLLSNDSDDIDDSNSPIVVLPEALEGPENAAFFELSPEGDGSFTYESSLTGIRTDQFDSFVYQLSDGVHVSTATATIRIVAANQAPELIDPIPELTAIEGERVVENLALYFLDPEESELIFSLAEDTPLPDDGNLSLSEEGVLSGIPGEDDVGTHVLTLIVSDGGAELETDVTLEIEAAPLVPENSAPEYIEDSVFNQIILLGRSIRPVIPEFIDPDGDTLSYAIAGNGELPDGVEIDEETGIVSGLPTEETNVRNLRIEATDPSGESAVSDAFYIWVR
ncbi:Ig-like domain-containing protein [Granulosicoccus sp. 3-233]|uniref:Ig-like domain-containing protein n=1 Tax=Granulosicoccus sp. 3-233 TaxID=3417969 RepID=UPI003D35596A